MAEGIRGLVIERVAAVAGVSKVTIYKWWPSRGVLAIEAHAAGVHDNLSVPDTGDIAADLVAHLTTFVELLRDTRAGQVSAELLGAAQADPQLADAFRRIYLQPRRAVGIARLETAQLRGEIRADADLEVLSDQLWGSCMYRLMTGLHPLDAEFVAALVRHTFAGVGTTSFSCAAEPARVEHSESHAGGVLRGEVQETVP